MRKLEDPALDALEPEPLPDEATAAVRKLEDPALDAPEPELRPDAETAAPGDRSGEPRDGADSMFGSALDVRVAVAQYGREWDRVREQAPVTQTLTCWKCGAPLAEVLVPFARIAECPRCRADLHVCRMCEFFDPGVRRGCKEPVADEVSDRERANFCGYFTPVVGAGPGVEDGASQAARAELDGLFSHPSSNSASPSDAGEAKRRLDELFGGGPKN